MISWCLYIFQAMQGHWFNIQQISQLTFVINIVMRCMLMYSQEGNPIFYTSFDYVIFFYLHELCLQACRQIPSLYSHAYMTPL